MRGGRGGRVVLPGNSETAACGTWSANRIHQMPPGQALITRKNHGNLKTWIEEGAEFDGPDPKATLRSLVPTEAELRAAALARLSPEEQCNNAPSGPIACGGRPCSRESLRNTRPTCVAARNVTPDRLTQYGDWADEAAEQIAKVFRAKRSLVAGQTDVVRVCRSVLVCRVRADE